MSEDKLKLPQVRIDTTWLESVWQDLRHAARMLRNSPGFTAGIIVTIALAGGAMTAVYSVFERVILRPLPIPKAEELRVVKVGESLETSSFSQPLYERIRSSLPAGVDIAALTQPRRAQVTMDNAAAEATTFQLVSGNFFETIQLVPYAGRFFIERELANANDAAVAVISHSFASRRWHGDMSVAIGKTIRLNGYPLTVIGITEPGFSGTHPGEPAEVWVPLEMQFALRYREDVSSFGSANTERPWRSQEGVFWLRLLLRIPAARLAADNAMSSITSTLNALYKRARAEVHGDDPNTEARRRYVSRDLSLEPGARGFDSLRPRFLTPMHTFLAMSTVVLLIACFNVATLLLSRAEARRREIGVRLAIGAGRGRIARQLLTESLLIAVVGSVIGTVVGLWIAPATLQLIAGGTLEVARSPNLSVLAFSTAICVAAALFCGVIPAVRATQVDPLPALKVSAGSVGSAPEFGGSRFIVSAQVAFATVLLVFAWLLVRTFLNLSSIDPGYSASALLSVRIDPRIGGYQSADLLPLYRRLHERLSGIPGVQAVSVSLCPLATGSGCGWYSAMYAPGFVPKRGESVQVQELFVSWNYLRVLGLELVQGRPFNERDTADSRPVVIVNQTLARYYFGTDEVIGRRIGYSLNDPARYEIIGVIRDVPINNLREPVPRFSLHPVGKEPVHLRNIDIRTDGNPSTIAQAVRRAIQETEPGLPITSVMTLTGQLALTFAPERALAWLSGAFGMIATVLACLGVYSLLSYNVTRRSAEIGLRMALGATPGAVQWHFLRRAIGLTLLGISAGIALSVAASKGIRHLLFGIAVTDSSAYLGAAALFAAVAFAAICVPVRRAAHIDPVVALRSE